MKNFIRVIEDICGVILVWWAVNGTGWAGNVLQFLSIILVLLAPFAIIGASAPSTPIYPYSTVSKWSRHLSYLVSILLLVVFGWIWCAVGLFVGWWTMTLIINKE